MSDDSYDRVGVALREAEAIRAAFEAILRQDFAAARRALAQAQRDHYSLRPWRPGVPTHDASGGVIVFEDQDGMRYTVHRAGAVRSDPRAHIRLLLFSRQFTGVFDVIEARARTSLLAAALAGLFQGDRDVDLEPLSSIGLADGGVALRYRFSSRKLPKGRKEDGQAL